MIMLIVKGFEGNTAWIPVDYEETIEEAVMKYYNADRVEIAGTCYFYAYKGNQLKGVAYMSSLTCD